MKLLYLYILSIIILSEVLHAQYLENCGSERYHLQMMNKENYVNQWKSTEDFIYHQSLSGTYKFKDTTYTIPVVFHLICRPGSIPGDFYAANPDDNTVINSFLSNLNSAYENSGAFDQGVGVDMNIRFCLAETDTSGQYTSGITRFESILSDSCGLTINAHYTDSVKHITSWDPERYLNIWIVASLLDASGFSTFPWSPREYRDGVIIDINYLMTDYIAGVMLAHEIGHYLGLYHVFQGGCPNNDCLMQGDRVCDTPPSTQDGFIVTCTDNTCTTDANDTSSNNPFLTDVNDNIRTYMNYGFPNCINQFTTGQKLRALTCLLNYRSALINNNLCLASSNTLYKKDSKNLSVFPNPVKDRLNVRLDNRYSEPVQFYLLDLTRKRIHISSEQSKNGYILTGFKKLAPGTYILVITEESIVKYQKIIVY